MAAANGSVKQSATAAAHGVRFIEVSLLGLVCRFGAIAKTSSLPLSDDGRQSVRKRRDDIAVLCLHNSKS
jgi:hypothetical protein